MSLQEEIAFERNQRLIGKEMRVLLDGKSSREGKLTARTEGNLLIEVEANEDKIGSIVKIKVDSARAWQLTGVMLEE